MQSPLNTDQLLLEALSKGESAATELIYKQHYKIINLWLRKNGSTADDAADIYQEAMVVLFGKVQDKEFRLSCSIGTYLFSICKHLWYKHLEKQNKNPVSLKDEFFNDGENGLSYEDDLNVHQERETHYKQLNTALEQLGEPCRTLLTAFYHQDKSMQEIAATFGYTNPENAKNQKYKCLARLRKLFYNMQAK